MTHRTHRLAIAGTSLVLALHARVALAVDMDIVMNDNQRRAAVAPHCAALKRKNTSSALDDYRKGLCLLYGLDRKEQPDKALFLLRKASDHGLTEAQLALADTLQNGTETDQRQALEWYARVKLAGDARAGARYDHLARRIDATATTAADKPIPDPPPGTIVNPTSQEMQSLYREGYHCHIMPFGQKWCHNTMD
jgi:TPR repeat protein